MSDLKRVSFETIKKPSSKSKATTPNESRTIRLELNLFEPNADSFPEFNYRKLLHVEKKKRKKLKKLNGFSDPFADNDEDVSRIAKELERKYGNSYTGKYCGTSKNIDYCDKGAGYDENDTFIDNTEAYDELIPDEIETYRGGFYINSGPLEFKQLSNFERPDDVNRMPKARKRILSVSESSQSNDDFESKSKSKKPHKTSDNKLESSVKKVKIIKDVKDGDNSDREKDKNKIIDKQKIVSINNPKEDGRSSDGGSKTIKTTTVKDMLRAKRDSIRNKIDNKIISTDDSAKESKDGDDEDDEDDDDDDDDEDDDTSSDDDGSSTSSDTSDGSDVELVDEKIPHRRNSTTTGSGSSVTKNTIRKSVDEANTLTTNAISRTTVTTLPNTISTINTTNVSHTTTSISAGITATTNSSIPNNNTSTANIINTPTSIGDTQSNMDSNNPQIPIEVKLPDKLPDDLLKLINKSIDAAKTSGKNNFFNAKTIHILSKIELSTRSLNSTIRNQIYSYLELHLQLTKQTINVRVKRYRTQVEDLKLNEIISKFKLAIDKVMPSLLKKYENEMKRYTELLQKNTINSPTAVDGLVNPRRQFVWSDPIRLILYDIVNARRATYEILRPRKESCADFVNRYLQDKIVPLWPLDWMHLSELQTEYDNRKAVLKSIAKHTKRIEPKTTSVQSSVGSTSNIIFPSAKSPSSSSASKSSVAKVPTSTSTSTTNITTSSATKTSTSSTIKTTTIVSTTIQSPVTTSQSKMDNKIVSHEKPLDFTKIKINLNNDIFNNNININNVISSNHSTNSNNHKNNNKDNNKNYNHNNNNINNNSNNNNSNNNNNNNNNCNKNNNNNFTNNEMSSKGGSDELNPISNKTDSNGENLLKIRKSFPLSNNASSIHQQNLNNNSVRKSSGSYDNLSKSKSSIQNKVSDNNIDKTINNEHQIKPNSSTTSNSSTIHTSITSQIMINSNPSGTIINSLHLPPNTVNNNNNNNKSNKYLTTTTTIPLPTITSPTLSSSGSESGSITKKSTDHSINSIISSVITNQLSNSSSTPPIIPIMSSTPKDNILRTTSLNTTNSSNKDINKTIREIPVNKSDDDQIKKSPLLTKNIDKYENHSKVNRRTSLSSITEEHSSDKYKNENINTNILNDYTIKHNPESSIRIRSVESVNNNLPLNIVKNDTGEIHSHVSVETISSDGSMSNDSSDLEIIDPPVSSKSQQQQNYLKRSHYNNNITNQSLSSSSPSNTTGNQYQSMKRMKQSEDDDTSTKYDKPSSLLESYDGDLDVQKIMQDIELLQMNKTNTNLLTTSDKSLTYHNSNMSGNVTHRLSHVYSNLDHSDNMIRRTT